MDSDLPMIGDLRHRVILENLDELPGGGPALARRFTPIVTLWAAVRAETGASYHLGQEVGAARIVFTVRAAPFLIGLDRVDRWLFWPAQGRRFRLLAVRRRDAAGRFLDLQASEEHRMLPEDAPAPGDADDNPV